jgi:hypothetical protein
MLDEVWKPVSDNELYEVSNLGRVRSLSRETRHWRGGIRVASGRLLQPALVRGYCQVKLHRNKHVVQVKVHRLVATAFLANPSGKPTVNHIDGNKLNNAVSNLEWATQGENNLHAYRSGLRRRA